MKTSLSGLVVSMILILCLVSACNTPSGAVIPVTGGGSTDTAAPPQEDLNATPPPTQTQCTRTSNLAVDVTKLSSFCFEVSPNTDLKVTDFSNDGKANECMISKPGFAKSITIPVGAPSETFQLSPGEYSLSCEAPNKVAQISSK